MRLSWKLGRVAGIDLYLHPSALILWLLAAGATGGGLFDVLPMVVALFGSITLHELGHALMARRYGIGTQDITLSLIGGIARLNRMPRSAGPEMLIALAGPAVNVVIAAASAVLIRLTTVAGVPLDSSLRWFLFQVLGLNVVLLVFNLLPIFPMDGGRVLRALLSGWLGRTRATEIASILGQICAVVGGVVGLGTGHWQLALLALFIYFAAARERAQVLAEERRFGQTQHGLTDPPAAPLGFRWADRGDGVWRLVPNIGRARTWGQS